LLAACASGISVNARSRAINIHTDLDGDGVIEHIKLDDKRDPSLSIRSGRGIIWQGVHRRWKPWKLVVADVDGDGRREIIVAVFKATRYLPRPHNCLFVYGWSGSRAYPKWLGSTLSKPFTEFAFANLDDDLEDELVAIETLRAGRHCVSVYSWNGFGFTLDRQQGSWGQARIIANDTNSVVIEADGQRITINNKH